MKNKKVFWIHLLIVVALVFSMLTLSACNACISCGNSCGNCTGDLAGCVCGGCGSCTQNTCMGCAEGCDAAKR
ncbi:MAG: hypothetical protein ACI3V2_06645 [Faecousia sp.]